MSLLKVVSTIKSFKLTSSPFRASTELSISQILFSYYNTLILNTNVLIIIYIIYVY